MGLLMGRALTWDIAIWEKEGETVNNYESFISTFHLHLCLGILRFSCREWLEWTNVKPAFRRGLNIDVFMELACWNDEATVDSLIDMVIQIDNRLQDRRHLKLSPALTTSVEPMQLGNTHMLPPSFWGIMFLLMSGRSSCLAVSRARVIHAT